MEALGSIACAEKKKKSNNSYLMSVTCSKFFLHNIPLMKWHIHMNFSHNLLQSNDQHCFKHARQWCHLPSKTLGLKAEDDFASVFAPIALHMNRQATSKQARPHPFGHEHLQVSTFH